jgi:hypothetical protein
LRLGASKSSLARAVSSHCRRALLNMIHRPAGRRM